MDSYETNYDKIAETYLRHAGDKVSWNNLYERPYMLSIFDDFSTVDASQKMFDHVAESISSPKLKLYRSDLADGLSFVESESLDYIVCSLALHYLENWEVIITEFYRALKKHGKLYISTHHPFADYLILKKENYFDKYLLEDTWGSGKNSFKVSFYTRSLSDLLKPFIHSAFNILSIDEPLPPPEYESFAPKVFRKLSKQPAFICLVLQK